MAYATIDDMRREGFPACDFTDDRVQKALDDATELIERTTGRWFEARDLTFDVWWHGSADLLLEHPIIRISDVRFVNTDGTTSTPLETADYIIFNRHVRMGLKEPDDRENPKLAWQFLRPDYFIPRPESPRLVQDLLTRRDQNVRLVGKWGYTEPNFSAGRSPTPAGTDAITAPDTIKVINAAFTAEDVGRTITVSAGLAANNGVRTIATVVSADTVTTVEQTLVTQASGFATAISAFPQFGVTPRIIKDVCLRIAAMNLPTLREQMSGLSGLSSGRITRMATRDQSITFAEDPRIAIAAGAGGDSVITGDPTVDRVLTMMRRPLKLGAA